LSIIFLLDGFSVGGTELNATRTLEALSRREIRVTVMHFHADGPLRARIAATDHHLVHTPIARLWHPSIAVRTATLARAFLREKASVVHTQDIYTNILGIAAGSLLRSVPVVTSRRWKNEVPRKSLSPLNAWAHRRSTLVLPNSAALIDTLVEEGVPLERIAVHQNFIDDAALSLLDGADRARWRAELHIPQHALVVGCVARLAPVKRHDVLLAAFAAATKEIPEALLVLVGDGECRQALEQQAIALEIRDRVRFTGTLPNYPLPQQLFDIGVLTSANEGFPNSLVEASATAIPLVTTRVGGATDLLVEGSTGLGVEVGDVHDTRRALLTLLTDAGLRTRMGSAGQALIRDRYSESAAIDRLLALYDRARVKGATPFSRP
jgi:glycosyltransferase involved in cell wall biosynthesis